MSESLPQQMRAAAKVLREADQRRYPNYHAGNEYAWYPKELESASHRFEAEDKEAEDRAKAEREAMVEELASAMFLATYDDDTVVWVQLNPRWQQRARKLIDAGWTKQAKS